MDEDTDSDSERNHISETAGVVAASTAFHAVINVNLTVSKSALTIEDDINGTTDPKAIPNARVEYAITTGNSGIKSPDSDSLVVTDDLPEETALCVTAACNPGGPIVLDTSASPFPPGVTLDTPNVRYSNDGGAPFTYTPIPDADGFDPAVDSMQVRLTGALAARTTAGIPEFTLRLVVRIN